MNRKNLRSLAAGVALMLAVVSIAVCGGESSLKTEKKW